MKKMIFSVLMLCGAAQAAPLTDGLYATLQTTMGDVCFELYYTHAPRTAANFVSLAEGTRPWIDPRSTFVSTKPYYNGLLFHRVVSGFMIQGGSPKGDGTDGPGYAFEDEFDSLLRHDRPGTVSMANSGPDSNGGQFFITVDSTPWLDDVHTVFGRVVEGMQVVSNMASVAVDANSRPLTDVTITNVFITRNGTGAQNFSVTNQLLPEVQALPLSIAATTLSAGTATSSYQYVYSSTNLETWSEAASGYWPVPGGAWELTASGKSREFFHANRVIYPSDSNRTGSPVSHRITVTIGSDVLTMAPDGINSGWVQVNSGAPESITYWSWDASPWDVTFIVQTDYYPFGFVLDYGSATNGTCDVYLYDYDIWDWLYLGAGTFTDENLNP
jgi:cyclophilin family peptidyl-prolyl cis-trans isomerase